MSTNRKNANILAYLHVTQNNIFSLWKTRSSIICFMTLQKNTAKTHDVKIHAYSIYV